MIPIEYFIDTSTDILHDILPKSVDKYLVVPVWFPLTEHFGSSTYTTKEIADSLHYHSRRINRKEGIVFLSHTEAFSVYYINHMQEVVKYLVEDYGYSEKKIIYIAGAHPTVDNVKLYLKMCSENNFYRLSIVLVNFMEIYTNNMNLSAKVDFEQVHTTPRLKSKKFTSLHGVPRLFRLALTGQLIKRNLIEQAFYTIWFNDPEKSNIRLSLDFEERMSIQFPSLVSDTIQVLSDNISKFPMKIYHTPTGGYTQDDVFVYNNSYFSLVGETVYASNKGLPDDIFYECYDFSEKLFRPIKFKHPFVLLARPNSLEVLRKYGYKTFHPFIDESYDLIENDEDRMLAIISEVERLCNFTNEQWLEFQKNVKDIVEHNATFLTNIGIKTLPIGHAPALRKINNTPPPTKENKNSNGILKKFSNLFGKKKT